MAIDLKAKRKNGCFCSKTETRKLVWNEEGRVGLTNASRYKSIETVSVEH